MKRRTALGVAALALAAVVGVAGCTPKPLNEYTLPGGTATGDDGYRVTAMFANAENLTPNSQVLYHDARIGTVRSITEDDWQAKVTVSLLKSVPLPADVTMRVAQKSLLGAEYLEIDVPSGSTVARSGLLRDHRATLISTSRTGHYPETEEILTGVALLLGNGGLGQIKTITTEIDKLFKGDRTQSARSLISNLTTFLGTLDTERTQIVSVIRSIDSLGTVLARERTQVATAITHVEPGLRLLAQQRQHLTTALTSVGRLGVIGQQVVRESGSALVSNLTSLKPTLTKLQQAGTALPDSLVQAASYPFPLQSMFNAFKGDYLNIYLTLHVTVGALAKDFGPVDTSVLGGTAAMQAKNPLTAPLGTHAPPTSALPTGSSSTPTTTPTRAPSPGPAGSSAPPSSTPTSSPTACNILSALLGGC